MGPEVNIICLLFPEPGVAEGFSRTGKGQDTNLMIWATNKKQWIGGGTASHQRVQRLDTQPSGDQEKLEQWGCQDQYRHKADEQPANSSIGLDKKYQLGLRRHPENATLQCPKGVLVIKNNIFIHNQGDEHEKNIDACAQRLHDYGIRLRCEKWKMGK